MKRKEIGCLIRWDVVFLWKSVFLVIFDRYCGQVSSVCHNKIIWTATPSRATNINISSQKTTNSTNNSSRTTSPHTTPHPHPHMQPRSSSPNRHRPSYQFKKRIIPHRGKSSVPAYQEVSIFSRGFSLASEGWATRQRSHSVLTIASPNTKMKRIPQSIFTPSAGIT